MVRARGRGAAAGQIARSTVHAARAPQPIQGGPARRPTAQGVTGLPSIEADSSSSVLIDTLFAGAACGARTTDLSGCPFPTPTHGTSF